MTDPRILECARALVPFSYGAFEYQLDADGNRVQPPLQPNERALEAARAVILKWLEQPPTESMQEAGDGVNWCIMPPLGRITIDPTDAYTAMCEQARKEIGRD